MKPERVESLAPGSEVDPPNSKPDRKLCWTRIHAVTNRATRCLNGGWAGSPEINRA